MFFALAFVVFRILQILTLLPCMGMLAWFVDGYNKNNILTPEPILVLFIVSVLALAWAIFTLFSYHRSSANALFVGIIDLGFVGALIAGVYYLRGIRNADCVNVSRGNGWDMSGGGWSVSGPSWDWRTDKSCAMLKASWAFGIMNIIFFFITCVVAFMHGDRISAHGDRKYRGSHHSRHGHRHRSHSGSRYSRTTTSRRVYV